MRFGCLLILTFLFMSAACEKDASETKPTKSVTTGTTATPMTKPSIPKDGNYEGRGVVTGIKPEQSSIEINHEEIKDMMPAMQMEFNVSDKSLLNNLKVGDKVVFVVEYKHPTEIITSLKKVP